MCLGVPGKIVALYESGDGMPMGKVSFAGVTKEVCLAYTPEAAVGDYVVVHVGFAISTVNEEEAQQVFTFLAQMDQLDEVTAPETQ